MADRTRGLGFLLAALLLAVGCAPVTRDLVSGAPPAVPAAGPIAGHPPITASGVVKSFDPATGILRFEDGRLVKLTADSKVVRPTETAVRAGDLVLLQDVLPVGVQAGVKTLAVGQPQRMATVASVDESSGLVQFTDGIAVRVASSTNLHLGATGSSTVLTDVRPGDEVVIVLVGPDPTPAAADATSALPRQDLSPPVEALELMIFRALR